MSKETRPITENIPPAVTRLAESNMRTLSLLGIDPKDPDIANDLFIQRRFTGLVTNGQFEFDPQLLEDFVETQVVNEIMTHNPAMILIRPDFYHAKDQFLKFLAENGFCPHFTADIKVPETTYEIMYHKVFSREEAKYSLPNRTAIYTDKPTTLVVFTDPQNRFPGKNLADAFVENFKGSGGVPDNQTIRGSVVFNEAIKLGYHQLDNPIIQQAVDPLGTYKKAVQSNGPHSHLPKEYQVLFYTGVGVHIPDANEMKRDLSLLCDLKELEEIKLRLEHPFIGYYTHLWNTRQIDKPLVLGVGGYAGTGKSTLVSKLLPWLPSSEKLATGQVRAILKRFISKDDNPWLYGQTYTLDQISPDSVGAIEGFELQVSPVASALQEIVNFAGVEKQLHILDGNHVFPGLIDFPEEVIGVDFYLKVDDPETHRQMIGGPTHQRTLSDHEFATARKLHDHIVAEALAHGKHVISHDTAYQDVLALLNHRLMIELSA